MCPSTQITKVGDKMKKTAIVLGALIASLSLSPAQAAEVKSLVIIDSYFDERVTGATIVCIAKDSCAKVAKPSKSVSDNVNHGNAMAEVAKRQNPGVKLTLLRSANTGGDVTGADLIRALRWVDANSSQVGAVSFSRSISNNANKGNCQLAPTGLAVEGMSVPVADQEIQRLIASLKSKGIPFFASTGNKSAITTTVTYPACLPITNSVTADKYAPALSNADTDYVGSLPANVYSYKGSIVWSTNGFIPQTTSSATAAVAAKFLLTTLDTKVVSVVN